MKLDEMFETPLTRILPPVLRHELLMFRDGKKDEMSDELYDKLFQFFADTGEMPYGTMKARTGDPYIWIHDKIMEIPHKYLRKMLRM